MTAPGAPPAAPGEGAMLGYGGFRLAGMELALPMAALREVVPMGPLTALPCPNPAVLGGIDLRGVTVPLLDLRIVAGRPAPALDMPNVVILVEDGCILGLLAEGVSGVFSAPAQALHPVRANDPVTAVLAGSLLRAADQQLVSVLSPAALAALPQVPWVHDPEPQRQARCEDAAEAGSAEADPARPTLLFRCGAQPFALDAMAVHATLSNPEVGRSALSQGLCLGELTHLGRRVPVVDLQALCGLGPLQCDGREQVVLLQLAEGLVAGLVSEVLDVVPARVGDRMPVPAFALPHPRLYVAALRPQTLPPDVLARVDLRAGQFLLLDGAALHADPVLRSLAGLKLGAGEAVAATAALTQVAAVEAQARGQGRAMLTYQLQDELATPILQVAEVLAWQPECGGPGSRGALLGLLSHQGRAIPVMCLARLTGCEPPGFGRPMNVLVVESGGERVGYAVSALRSIEPADWEPELRHGQPDSTDALQAVLGERKLALVGPAGAQRMLRVLDLERLAGALRGEALAA